MAIARRDLPVRDTRKGDDRAHIPRARNQFASRSRLKRIIVNAFYPEAEERITPMFCRVLPFAFLLPNVLGIRIPRAVVCANCLSCQRDLPASLPRAIYKPLDYQVRITDARILTIAQVIGLQASLTAHFEYILKLTQQ